MDPGELLKLSTVNLMDQPERKEVEEKFDTNAFAKVDIEGGTPESEEDVDEDAPLQVMHTHYQRRRRRQQRRNPSPCEYLYQIIIEPVFHKQPLSRVKHVLRILIILASLVVLISIANTNLKVLKSFFMGHHETTTTVTIYMNSPNPDSTPTSDSPSSSNHVSFISTQNVNTTLNLRRKFLPPSEKWMEEDFTFLDDVASPLPPIVCSAAILPSALPAMPPDLNIDNANGIAEGMRDNQWSPPSASIAQPFPSPSRAEFFDLHPMYPPSSFQRLWATGYWASHKNPIIDVNVDAKVAAHYQKTPHEQVAEEVQETGQTDLDRYFFTRHTLAGNAQATDKARRIREQQRASLVKAYAAEDIILPPATPEEMETRACPRTAPVTNQRVLKPGFHWYTPAQACYILSHFVDIEFEGDSLIRHTWQSMLLILTGDYEYGHVQRAQWDSAHGMGCNFNNAYAERDCRATITWNIKDSYRELCNTIWSDEQSPFRVIEDQPVPPPKPGSPTPPPPPPAAPESKPCEACPAAPPCEGDSTMFRMHLDMDHWAAYGYLMPNDWISQSVHSGESRRKRYQALFDYQSPSPPGEKAPTCTCPPVQCRDRCLDDTWAVCVPEGVKQAHRDRHAASRGHASFLPWPTPLGSTELMNSGFHDWIWSDPYPDFMLTRFTVLTANYLVRSMAAQSRGLSIYPVWMNHHHTYDSPTSPRHCQWSAEREDRAKKGELHGDQLDHSDSIGCTLSPHLDTLLTNAHRPRHEVQLEGVMTGTWKFNPASPYARPAPNLNRTGTSPATNTLTKLEPEIQTYFAKESDYLVSASSPFRYSEEGLAFCKARNLRLFDQYDAPGYTPANRPAWPMIQSNTHPYAEVKCLDSKSDQFRPFPPTDVPGLERDWQAKIQQVKAQVETLQKEVATSTATATATIPPDPSSSGLNVLANDFLQAPLAPSTPQTLYSELLSQSAFLQQQCELGDAQGKPTRVWNDVDVDANNTPPTTPGSSPTATKQSRPSAISTTSLACNRVHPWEIYDTIALTDGLGLHHTYDGMHVKQKVNLLKAQGFLNYLHTIIQESKINSIKKRKQTSKASST